MYQHLNLRCAGVSVSMMYVPVIPHRLRWGVIITTQVALHSQYQHGHAHSNSNILKTGSVLVDRNAKQPLNEDSVAQVRKAFSKHFFSMAANMSLFFKAASGHLYMHQTSQQRLMTKCTCTINLAFWNYLKRGK